MKTINFKHSIIFFNLCILIIPFSLMLNYEPIILCLFAILIIGISHGSLDDIKGKKLLKLFGYRSSVLFYFIYLIISLLIIVLWLLLPNAILLLFLIVAAFHFGKEDTIFTFKGKFWEWLTSLSAWVCKINWPGPCIDRICRINRIS